MTTVERPLQADERWTSSTIRDLLAHAEQPGLVSLAGGLPAEEALPTERLATAASGMFERFGPRGLQYSATVGEPALRELVASFEAVHPDDVVITTGSQQALDLIIRSLTRPGDIAVIETPGYVGAIQALRGSGLELVGCRVDDDGIDTDQLEEFLRGGLRPAVVYTNPTHQNPTGAQLSPARAQQLAALAETYDFWVIADDPYREISFGPGSPAPEEGLHPSMSDRLMLLGSLSKTLSPGLRVGWCSGPVAAMRRVAIAKQAADLHTPTMNQLIAASVLSDHRWWIQHMQSLRSIYRARSLELAASIERHMPDATSTTARGGFFLWVTLPGVDTSALLHHALGAGVAFVPGSAFTIDDADSSSLRLSYSYAPIDQFDLALERLATVTESAARS